MSQDLDMTGDDCATSRTYHEQAQAIFPGGISHNTRYAEPHPIYVDRATGSRLIDVDGNSYIDFWNNHGASLLGHTPSEITDEVVDQVKDGFHYGTPNKPAIDLGQKILDTIPAAEQLRFCCSGTEATMFAVRLARAATGGDTILKMEAGWHGGNTDLTIAVHPPYDEPTTNGLPPGVTESTIAVPMNDTTALDDAIATYGDDLAGVIIDPRKGIAGPDDAYLDALVDYRDELGYQLIFDEVVTGYRVSPGTYQARADIDPDLTTLGKIVGGGLPIGALAGKESLFHASRPDVALSPDERIIAGGGTFSINPTSMKAGLATLEFVEDNPVYEHTESLGKQLRSGLREIFDDESINGEVLGFSSLFKPVFNPEKPLKSPSDVATATDSDALKTFQRRMLEHGYFFNRGSMGNISYAHTEDEIAAFLDDAHEVLRSMQSDDLI